MQNRILLLSLPPGYITCVNDDVDIDAVEVRTILRSDVGRGFSLARITKEVVGGICVCGCAEAEIWYGGGVVGGSFLRVGNEVFGEDWW